MTQSRAGLGQSKRARAHSRATSLQKLPWGIEMLPPSKLRPPPRNPRTHSDKQIEQIANSMLRFGAINPVIVDERNRVRCGNGRVEAAKKIGLKLLPVIRVSNLSDEEFRAYSLADNQIATKAGYDRQLLAIELAELQVALPEIGLDLGITGFDPGEVDAILEDFSDEATNDADDLPGLIDEQTVSRSGDAFILGQHRLLVGDARNAAAFAKLMQGDIAEMGIHDVPYNVRLQGNVGGRGRIKRREFFCASGEMTSSEYTDFLKVTLGHCAEHSADGAIHFSFIDWRHIGEMLAAGKAAFEELKQLCVWVKTNAGQGSFFRSQHELVFVWKHGRAPHLNTFGLGSGGRTRSNVWRYAGVNTFRTGLAGEPQTYHPTVKPVAMIADAMRDCSQRGSIILDAFAGSGTTIIAAEKIGRRAFCMEIDPQYADVTIRRWQLFTKRDAVLEDSGETFDKFAKRRARDPQMNGPQVHPSSAPMRRSRAAGRQGRKLAP